MWPQYTWGTSSSPYKELSIYHEEDYPLGSLEDYTEKIRSPNFSVESVAFKLGLSPLLTKLINEAGNNQGWPEHLTIPSDIIDAFKISFSSTREINDKLSNITKYYEFARKDLLGDDVE